MCLIKPLFDLVTFWCLFGLVWFVEHICKKEESAGLSHPTDSNFSYDNNYTNYILFNTFIPLPLISR